MNKDINWGESIVLAIAILIKGAVTVIETNNLHLGNDEPNKQRWRNRLFIKNYWICPFSSTDVLRGGIMNVVSINGGTDLPSKLSELLHWIDNGLEPEQNIDQKGCKDLNDRIFKPALAECMILTEGNIPVSASNG